MIRLWLGKDQTTLSNSLGKIKVAARKLQDPNRLRTLLQSALGKPLTDGNNRKTFEEDLQNLQGLAKVSKINKVATSLKALASGAADDTTLPILSDEIKKMLASTLPFAVLKGVADSAANKVLDGVIRNPQYLSHDIGSLDTHVKVREYLYPNNTLVLHATPIEKYQWDFNYNTQSSLKKWSASGKIGAISLSEATKTFLNNITAILEKKLRGSIPTIPTKIEVAIETLIDCDKDSFISLCQELSQHITTLESTYGKDKDPLIFDNMNLEAMIASKIAAKKVTFNIQTSEVLKKMQKTIHSAMEKIVPQDNNLAPNDNPSLIDYLLVPLEKEITAALKREPIKETTGFILSWFDSALFKDQKWFTTSEHFWRLSVRERFKRLREVDDELDNDPTDFLSKAKGSFNTIFNIVKSQMKKEAFLKDPYKIEMSPLYPVVEIALNNDCMESFFGYVRGILTKHAVVSDKEGLEKNLKKNLRLLTYCLLERSPILFDVYRARVTYARRKLDKKGTQIITDFANNFDPLDKEVPRLEEDQKLFRLFREKITRIKEQGHIERLRNRGDIRSRARRGLSENFRKKIKAIFSTIKKAKDITKQHTKTEGYRELMIGFFKDEPTSVKELDIDNPLARINALGDKKETLEKALEDPLTVEKALTKKEDRNMYTLYESFIAAKEQGTFEKKLERLQGEEKVITIGRIIQRLTYIKEYGNIQRQTLQNQDLHLPTDDFVTEIQAILKKVTPKKSVPYKTITHRIKSNAVQFMIAPANNKLLSDNWSHLDDIVAAHYALRYFYDNDSTNAILESAINGPLNEEEEKKEDNTENEIQKAMNSLPSKRKASSVLKAMQDLENIKKESTEQKKYPPIITTLEKTLMACVEEKDLKAYIMMKFGAFKQECIGSLCMISRLQKALGEIGEAYKMLQQKTDKKTLQEIQQTLVLKQGELPKNTRKIKKIVSVITNTEKRDDALFTPLSNSFKAIISKKTLRVR